MPKLSGELAGRFGTRQAAIVARSQGEQIGAGSEMPIPERGQERRFLRSESRQAGKRKLIAAVG